jgi:hypothetical protein
MVVVWWWYGGGGGGGGEYVTSTFTSDTHICTPLVAF